MALLVVSVASAQLASGGWPSFRGNALNTGIGLGKGQTGAVKWTRTSFSKPFISTAAIGPDGTVYVVNSDGNLYALDGSTGATKWTLQIGADGPGQGYLVSSPAIGADGTIYIGSASGGFYAVNSLTGILKWKFKVLAVDSSPTIGPDNSVYFGGMDGAIYSVKGATGALNWSYQTGGSVSSSPALGPDGTLYIGSQDDTVYALNSANGTKKWSAATYGMVISSPAIGPDGTVYVGSADNNVYAFSGATGSTKWASNVGSAVYSSPALSTDGASVYVATTESYLYILKAAGGALEGKGQNYDIVFGSPVVTADDTVWVAGNVGDLIAYYPDSAAPTWLYRTGQGFGASPAIGADGFAYAGAALFTQSGSYSFYAVQSANDALSSISINPSGVLGGNSAIGTITLTNPARAGGDVITLSANGNASVTIPISVTIPAGQSSANFTVETAMQSGTAIDTIYASLRSIQKGASITTFAISVKSVTINPTSLVGGNAATATVTLSLTAPDGGVPVGLSSSSSLVTVPASITVPAGRASVVFPITTAHVTTQTQATVTASTPVGGASVTINLLPNYVSSLVLSPAALLGGASSVARLTLAVPSPNGGLTSQISSNSSVASPPSFVTIPSGQSSATFTIKTKAVTNQTVAQITTTVNGVQTSAQLTINPITIATIAINPNTVVGGKSAAGTLSLTGAVPSGGLIVTLSSSLSAVTVPTTLKIAGGKSSGTFTIKTAAISATSAATIIGSVNGIQTRGTMQVLAPSIASVRMNPAKVKGGSSSSGTVVITSAAPQGGFLVSLATGSSAISTPVSVTIAAGKTSATFAVKTSKVKGQTDATITASNGTSSALALMTVTP